MHHALSNMLLLVLLKSVRKACLNAQPSACRCDVPSRAPPEGSYRHALSTLPFNLQPSRASLGTENCKILHIFPSRGAFPSATHACVANPSIAALPRPGLLRSNVIVTPIVSLSPAKKEVKGSSICPSTSIFRQIMRKNTAQHVSDYSHLSHSATICLNFRSSVPAQKNPRTITARSLHFD